MRTIFPISLLPHGDYIKTWIEVFLSDLKDRYRDWEKINPSLNDRSPIQMTFKDSFICLKKAKWYPQNQGDWLSFEYSQSSKFNLTISLHFEGLEIQLWEGERSVIGLFIYGINWNPKAKIFTLDNLFVSVLKNAGNEELLKVKGKIKMLPQFDLTFENILREVYNKINIQTEEEENFIKNEFLRHREEKNPYIWDTKLFTVFYDETQQIIFIKKEKINKSPLQLIEEDKRNNNKNITQKKTATYTVVETGSKLRKVIYPKGREFIYL